MKLLKDCGFTRLRILLHVNGFMSITRSWLTELTVRDEQNSKHKLLYSVVIDRVIYYIDREHLYSQIEEYEEISLRD